MTKSKPNKWLYWSPRVLAIFFIVFISLFALDVFVEGYSFLETIFALFMHLIPSFVLIIFLIIAWKYEYVGGILFLIIGLLYIIFAWHRDLPISAYLIISGSAFLIGILFFLNKIFSK